MPVEYCNVTGTFKDDATNLPASVGSVTFSPSVSEIVDAATDEIITLVPKTFALVNGELTASLIKTDIVDINPKNWHYNVDVVIGGKSKRTYAVQLTTATKDISDTFPVVDGEGIATVVLRGETGPPVDDGDKGDVIVSNSGTVWTVTGPKTTDAEALAGTDDIGWMTSLKVHSVVRTIPVAPATGIAATDMSNIQTVFTGAPDGSTIRFNPGSTAYRLNGAITTDGKSLTIDATDVNFYRENGAITSFFFAGGYDTPIVVNTITEGDYTADEVTQKATFLTLATAPPWIRGDIVKVFGDDTLPASRPTGALRNRVGTYFTVAEVTGTSVTLYGRVLDPISTNIRAARLPNRTVIWKGGSFITDPAAMGAASAPTVLTFKSLVDPWVDNLRIESCPGPGITFSGCFKYRVTWLRIGEAANNTANSQYGYGIADSSSALGRVSNYIARRLRHAFTTSNPGINAADPDPAFYGQSWATEVVDSVAYHPTAIAWDTHADSESIEFINCRSIDGWGCLGFRGRRHRASGCTAVRPREWGIGVFNEAAGGESYGHVLTDFVVDRPDKVSVNVDLRPAGHPNAGLRQPESALIIDGLTVIGAIERSVFARNCILQIDRFRSQYGSQLVSGTTCAIQADNADITGTDWRLETQNLGNGVVANGVVSLENSAALNVRDWWWRSFNSGAEAFPTLLYTTALVQKTVLTGVLLDRIPTSGVISNLSHFPDNSSVDWSSTDIASASNLIVVTNAAIADAAWIPLHLGRCRRPDMTALCSPDVSRTIPALKNGLINGQRLHIINTSTVNNVVIPHGDATYNTTLAAGVDRTVNPKTRVTLIWTGSTWIDY